MLRMYLRVWYKTQILVENGKIIRFQWSKVHLFDIEYTEIERIVYA